MCQLLNQWKGKQSKSVLEFLQLIFLISLHSSLCQDINTSGLPCTTFQLNNNPLNNTNAMKQKVVIKLSMNGQKSRSKALKTVVSVSGCQSVALQGQDKDQILVIGDGLDAVALTSLLRKKMGSAELVSVAEVGEKKEGGKKETIEKKNQSIMIQDAGLVGMEKAQEQFYGPCSLLGCVEEEHGERVLEAPSFDLGEKEELEEMRWKAEALKWEAKVLKRSIDFLHFILSYLMKSKAEKESTPSLGSKFSSINKQIRKFEASILDKINGRYSNVSSDDIDMEIQKLFHKVRRKLVEFVLYMVAYLPQDMLEYVLDMAAYFPQEIAFSASRSIPVELTMPPTSTKSENVTRPYEDDQMLREPGVIHKLAINSAVHQILDYFEDRIFGKIGISGSGWEEVAKALKDLPKIRNMFDVVQTVSLSRHQSIIELQMNILEQVQRPSNVSSSLPQPTSLLLLVDFIDQQIDLQDLELVDNVCIVLKTRPQKVGEIMALDLEIRIEDHLLPWNVFCKNVGRVLDHSPTLQQKAGRLIEGCHGHLLAIVLLAGALKDVNDACVWELAIEELMWQPSSEVQGMNVVMINVLRFIWERMGTTSKNCMKGLLHNSNETNKASLIFHWITNGWIETRDEGERILEGFTTSFLLESVGEGSFRMRGETRLVLLNIFILGKDPAYLKHGDLGLTETPKDEEWVAKEINLMNNKLSELPESPNCLFLVKLFLQGNYDLMVIPPSFFECMPVLEVLDLSYTNIQSLPKSISKLGALREFFLRGCDLLMELPPEIGALTNLEVFDLQGTEIMNLPKEIGKIINLTSLKVSFNECADLCRQNMEVNTIIPRAALPNLSQLNELSIDVHPDGDWWDVEVKAIINELCSLKKLRILKLYIPIVELLEDLRWDSTSLIYPTLTHFRFIVGRHKQRFISRVPHKIEEEFDNLEKGLKYINGEGIPTEISKALKHADAFFLERHWTIKYLSEFGLQNMDKLKFCLLVECNELQAIIDAKQKNQGSREEDESDESEPDLDFDEEFVLRSLQYLHIHYMKNMESICKGPIMKGCLSNLKSLALHTCPSLTTIFTLSMLGNLHNLEELIVEVCPKISSLVSLECSNLKPGYFLPSLKKISLLGLPELVTISSGLCIAPKLESMVVFYCPKLKMLSSMEVSSKYLKVIKGEIEWWDELMWHESNMSSDHQVYLARTFIPLRRDGDLMAQLTEG